MISIYTLTSPLHDEKAVAGVTAEFLGGLGIEYAFRGADFSDYGTDDLSLIYVRTGGTEGIFKSLLPVITAASRKIYLLTSGKSNSLAASMEILSYLRKNGLSGEIIHGSSEYIRSRIGALEKVERARKSIEGLRLGVVGKPSDWLISSGVDYALVRKKTGIEIVDIEIEELIAETGKVSIGEEDVMSACGEPLKSAAEKVRVAAPGATAIYHALKNIVRKYGLNGLTLRCFDMLDAVGNTGCIALAQLNAEGIVSSCEGDIPALLSMVVANALTGVSGFQANPSRINPQTGEVVFAHCTIPFNMVDFYTLDTHFESGIGVGIKGELAAGPVTVFKVAGDFSRHFAAEGMLIRNLSERDLCRTQVVLNLDRGAMEYFLNGPIGNHHIIVPGHCANLLAELLG